MPFTRILSAFVLVPVLAAGASAQLEVDWADGDLGGSVDFVLRAPAGTTYVNVLSLTEGPTCFGGKHTVGCVDVDFATFYLSFLIPGFFGTMGASGELVVTVGVPNDPVLDGLVLNEQMISLVNGKFTAKSNLCKLVFGTNDTWSHSLGTMTGDSLGVPAIELDDGRVLLAGGSGANLDVCELYDPCTQEFSAAASLATGRAAHTVTKLGDGRVLVAGGSDINGGVLSSAELFDPSTGLWSAVGSLGNARAGHSATRLPDGRVLIVAGTDDLTDVLTAVTRALKSTELFDPATLAFTAGPNLAKPHVAHAAVQLGNGDVLIGGGGTWTTVIGLRIPALTKKAQVYSASSGTFASEIDMKEARVAASSILLSDGRALFAGGVGGSITALATIATSETYDPSTNSFTSQGSMSVARALMTVLELDGSSLVLVAGGGTNVDILNPAPTDVAEVFDPTTNSFTPVATMPEPRAGAGGLVLRNHHSILFGGAGTPSSASIYRD